MTVAHIRCGSDIRDALAEAGVDGAFIEWSDPICRGPVPPGLDRPALRRTRADWLARLVDQDAGTILATLAEADDAVTDLSRFERVILWFEHDLYDQACLIALLSHIDPRPGLFLLSIDRHPAHDRFLGFGQLAPTELAALLGRETEIGPRHFETARRAYDIYRRGETAEITALANAPETGTALPFLPGALRRHLAEAPDPRDGLSLTERLTLRALADGARTPGQCFRALMERLDPQPFLGDLLYWEDIARLAADTTPLIGPVPGAWTDAIAPTDLGRAVLAGEALAPTRPRWWGGRLLS